MTLTIRATQQRTENPDPVASSAPARQKPTLRKESDPLLDAIMDWRPGGPSKFAKLFSGLASPAPKSASASRRKTPEPASRKKNKLAVRAGDERLIDYCEVCGMLGVVRSTLSAWVREGRFPQPFHLSAGRVRWRQSVVEKWVAEREGASA